MQGCLVRFQIYCMIATQLEPLRMERKVEKCGDAANPHISSIFTQIGVLIDRRQ